MKKTYIRPELDLLKLDVEDIITNSMPFIPHINFEDADMDGIPDDEQF